jgi:trans-2,3-dihydro-3-hydroxyanthranilate isomerase
VSLPFTIADVFTDQPLAGNQLAVFLDAGDIDERLLQPIAREIGFSETVFVLPGDVIRIFTPSVELPFAGHPVLGTAFVLASQRGAGLVKLQTGRGEVPVVFEGANGRRGRMSQPLPAVSPWTGDHDELFGALGVDGSLQPVDQYDNGPRYLYVVVADDEAVSSLAPDLGRLANAIGMAGVSCAAGRGTEWKCRMFAPGLGVAEDPATGSAAGPLAVHLCRHGLVPWGTEITITQGVELRRPSTLYATAHGDDDRLVAVEVAGDTVVIGRGSLEL